MKTQNRLFGLVFLMFVFSLGFTGCSKDEPIPPPADDGKIDEKDKPIEESKGLSEDDLVTYLGELGIVVDARKIAKKGYQPTTVKLTVDSNSGDYSQTVELNEYSLMGQIKLPIEELSAAAIDELTDGVEVVAELFDASGTSILVENLSKISFQSNPLPTICNGNDLEDLNNEFSLSANTPYYLQNVVDGNPITRAAGRRDWGPGDHRTGDITNSSGVTFSGDEDGFLFYFDAIPGKANTYAIKSKASNDYLKMNDASFGFITLGFKTVNSGFAFSNDNPDQQFVIEKADDEDGGYLLKNLSGEAIQVTGGIGLTIGHLDEQDIRFRFVPMNIDWNIENIGTEYLSPILPAAQNGFSYNSTLINCGQGGLSQTIGNSKNVTTTTTVGWEEALSISSSHSVGASLTLGLEVSASFFGTGATVSAEATGYYDYTTTSTTDRSDWNQAEGSSSDTFFAERTITVPSKSASLVYDAFQSYKNIKVNVVQRLRVKATDHDNGESLAGEEISTQFHFNGFEGVITEVGGDYIEVTLRGVANMDQVFESKSEVKDVVADCGG